MTYNIEDPGVWRQVGRLDGLQKVRDGGDDFGWGTVPTKKQQLTFSGEIGVYKLVRTAATLEDDFYLLVGTVFHGISGSPDKPEANWVSVGFFANYHSLVISSPTPHAKVVEFGPNSTVEQVSVSFTLGGSVGGGGGVGPDGPEGSAEIGLNASVGVSFSSDSVRFAARPTLSSMEWRTDLPGVGFVSPAVPANPFRASYAGYEWSPALIYRVPVGADFKVTATLSVDFEYDWTRGITARSFTDSVTSSYPPAAEEATTGVEGQQPPSMTILETLRSLASQGPGQPGQTDTFLAALESDWLTDAFGDSNLQTLVIVPTNQAIADYLDAHPDVALQSGGPLSPRWLSEWLSRHLFNIVPVTTGPDLDQAGMPPGEYIACTDGLICLTDRFDDEDHAAQVREALARSARA
ncbi:hypothetical protein [Ornithinimicrobium cerasi]|uniref:hypothetical protein n=1 Tax=Ornithinimicrobium cerasi TaxID=2248773 RepID=UPI000EFF0A8A|nr:hypothetical protein [Ornithinimicrobium cerasi]